MAKRLKCRHCGSVTFVVVEEPLADGGVRLHRACFQCSRELVLTLGAKAYKRWLKVRRRAGGGR
jgi:hypothetical protein